MDEVVAFFRPEIVVFMGDLFHSSLNKEWELFERWTSRITSKLILVVGNHDIISPSKYERLGVQVVSEIQSNGFLLTHHPDEKRRVFQLLWTYTPCHSTDRIRTTIGSTSVLLQI